MSKQLKKKLAGMILVEILFIFLLGGFLFSLQTSLSIANQDVSNREKLDQIECLLQNLDDEKKQTYDSYDEVYSSKARSIAFMARKQSDFSYTDAKMRELSKLMQVDNVMILDAQGHILAGAYGHDTDFTVSRYNQLRTVFSDSKPSSAFNVTKDGVRLRYYGAKIDADTMAVVAENPSELYSTLANTTSVSSVFSRISVGLSGYAFAVSHQDYSFLYYPDEALIGTDAVSAGFDTSRLKDGFSGWVTIDGRELYCTSRLIDNIYAVCAIPRDEINSSRFTTVMVTLITFAIAVTLIITYAIFLNEQELGTREDVSGNYKKAGPFYINTAVASKLFSVGMMGVVAILLVSVFMQTLFSLSKQTMSNRHPLTTIREAGERNTQEIEILTNQYNERYLNKCQVLAEILKQNPSLLNKQDLAELSEILGVINIWVYDENGRTIATDSPFWDFKLSNNPAEQSYQFKDLIKGYSDYLIQEARPDEVSGEMRQYIGVTMREGNEHKAGFVQICIAPDKLQTLLSSTTIESALSGIKVGTNGFAFAIDKEDHTFTYYPETKMIGKSVYDYGITDFSLHDDFSDFIKIRSEKYYCSSMELGPNLIYVAVPSTEMNRFCIPVALTTSACCLLCLLVIGLILTLSRRIPEPQGNESSQTGSSVIDVVMPDGRVKKTLAATVRWNTLPGIDWQEKTPEQKLLSVMNFLLATAAFLLLVVILFKDYFFSGDSIMQYVLSGGWERSLNIFALTNAIILFVIANVIAAIVRRLLMAFARIFGARGETICRLLDNVIKYMTVLCILYYCLGMFGVDTRTLLASAGILSVIIGLGSQSLISDILAGLFIVFEGEFRVGDIVTIGDWRGTVLEIGVRTTKIEDASKNIKIVSNSSVTGVINMTKQYSYASCDVGIEYSESLERVEHILQKELPLMKQRVPSIVDGPFYKGVVALGDSSVNIRLIAQCAETDRLQLCRDMNREIKLIFDNNNINIPYPQIVLNKPQQAVKATEEDRIQSAVFVKEQKEISKDLEEFDEDEK